MLLNEKEIKTQFINGVYTLKKNNKNFRDLFDNNIIKLIYGYIPDNFINRNISSLLDHKPKTGTQHTTVVLEYLKRFKNNVYLVSLEDPDVSRTYSDILSILIWGMYDTPFRKDDVLIHLISEYVSKIENSDEIREDNISYCRYTLLRLFYDTEAFLGSIYYMYRTPNWRINHNFLLEYIEHRLGHSYYFN